MKEIFVVSFKGAFSFLKPFSALRDSEIYSQQFITTSTLIGIEFKLFEEESYKVTGKPTLIKRHKLNYECFSKQQENVSAEYSNFKFEKSKSGKIKCESIGIINRHVLLNPELFLGFEKLDYALLACKKIIKLGRSEDFLYPNFEILKMSEEEFDNLKGTEFFEDSNGMCVGFNRFDNYSEMLGVVNIKN